MRTDQEPNKEESLWDAHDVARFLKASRSWVYLQAESGRLPSIRLGGLLRFKPSAIRAMVEGDESSGNRVVALPTPSGR